MKTLTAVLTIALLSGAGQTLACSYDGQMNNPFTQSYPGSLNIALATRAAIENGTLTPPESLRGQPGLRRASWWLNLLARELSEHYSADIYVYLVDSHLWSRVSPDLRHPQIHSDPAPTGSQVLLLSEATLYELVNNRLSLSQAVDIGIAQFSLGAGKV
ncbi:hypothetical protein [Photobacterium ganghwense]|uniref:hypothetical protein n=1 Tax=Photobacterium ganghwense TaxID=320778 RepID=UPI001C2D9CAA|nr:hypothetical protein [Photobacterium ganghwense]MBV1841298.1 hypothetical protein [Photobacterium ganghwense]